MQKRRIFAIGAAVLLAALACLGLYHSGFIGITADQINAAQEKTVDWDAHDYTVIGSCADGSALYVGMMYQKDYSDARYFIYINRSGLPFGWHFLRSGSLSEVDGLRCFDCGDYGRAYVALNAGYDIQKIEFSDGREPPVTEHTNRPIVEQSTDVIYFYDRNGSMVEPSVLRVID